MLFEYVAFDVPAKTFFVPVKRSYVGQRAII